MCVSVPLSKQTQPGRQNEAIAPWKMATRWTRELTALHCTLHFVDVLHFGSGFTLLVHILGFFFLNCEIH